MKFLRLRLPDITYPSIRKAGPFPLGCTDISHLRQSFIPKTAITIKRPSLCTLTQFFPQPFRQHFDNIYSIHANKDLLHHNVDITAAGFVGTYPALRLSISSSTEAISSSTSGKRCSGSSCHSLLDVHSGSGTRLANASCRPYYLHCSSITTFGDSCCVPRNVHSGSDAR